jgi:pSer/pThr/pTyr-binding forkhead associated (FHA) protein
LLRETAEMIQIKPDAAPYDDSHYLLLKGVEGVGAGETVKISLGESVEVGRSRHCGWSLKKTARYLKDVGGEREAIRESVAFRSVSRRHCRITYLAPDLVEVVNLSRNGTFVDGHRVDRIVLDDCRRASHRIRLGKTGDVVELSCGSAELVAPSARSAPGSSPSAA